jgi:hypothetical protein
MWWHEMPYNIGIATGPSKLLAIDCDTTEDTVDWRLTTDGVAIRGRLLPATFTVRTPSGGRHLYFRAPGHPTLGNTAGMLGRHVDTRGAGGYVVGPGSVCSTGYYTIISDNPVVQLPQWVVEALMPRTSAPSTSSVQVSGSVSTSTNHYLRAIVVGESERVRTAKAGARNNALNTAAYLLGQLVGSGEISQQEAWRVLQEASAVHLGVRRFTEREMRATIKSGLTAGIRRPRYLTRQPRRGAELDRLQ